MFAVLLPSIDLLPGVFSGMALFRAGPRGDLISLKWKLALPVSEYTAIVCRPFAQCDAWVAGRTCIAESRAAQYRFCCITQTDEKF
jgi:hypothetical protein